MSQMEERMIRAHCARLVTTNDNYICEPKPYLIDFVDELEGQIGEMRKEFGKMTPVEIDPKIAQEIEAQGKIEAVIRKECIENGPPTQKFINDTHRKIHPYFNQDNKGL